MTMRRVGAATVLGLGMVVSGAVTPAFAVPSAELKGSITAGCSIDGETMFIDVIPQGAVAFVVDEQGEPTGDKYFLVSLDSAAFTDDGQLVDESHQSYGQRRGHGEQYFCSGSFVPEPGITVFFDALVTNP